MPRPHSEPSRIVPGGMNRTELASVNWVLARIKEEVLKGRPSGQVLDQAIEEVMESAIQPRQP